MPICHYSGQESADAVKVGAFVPGVKAVYWVSPERMAEHKQSGIWFHESEANCNTCKHLERVKHAKNTGFLYGVCKSANGQPDKSPYADKQKDGVMMFHPDDPMHMPCYESRWT